MIGPSGAVTALTIGFCEDDPAIRRLLGEVLESAGHRWVAARRSAEAMRALSGPGFDVLVLDVGLPDGDGRDLCRALRANGQVAPVLFLTALGAVHDVVEGFNAGGLDWLVKPFAVPELVARIEALARRTDARTTPSGVELDPVGHRIRTATGERLLTPTEFRIAAALLARPGHVVRRGELVDAAWVPGAHVQGNTLDAYVHRLRRHLAAVGAEVGIRTVRGVGYVVR